MRHNWTKVLRIRDGALLHRDKPLHLPDLEFLAPVGSGANGVVFKVRNKWLNREEALKVWLKLKPDDDRDKVIQGTFEAQKLAEVESQAVLPIYAAGVVDGLFFSTMQLLPTTSLKALLADPRIDTPTRLMFGRRYTKALFDLANSGLVHGDPHPGNVLLKLPANNMSEVYSDAYHWEGIGPLGFSTFVFCDFGTSIFNKKGDLRSRNRRVAEETILKIFDDPELIDVVRTELSDVATFMGTYERGAAQLAEFDAKHGRTPDPTASSWHPRNPSGKFTLQQEYDHLITQRYMSLAASVDRSWRRKHRAEP